MLNEDALLDDLIRLEGPGFDAAERDDFDITGEYADVMVWVHRDTGQVLLVEVDRFRAKAEEAIKDLRETPLPWTFSLTSLGIKEKPLEDIVLAVWKKFKNVKMEWE